PPGPSLCEIRACPIKQPPSRLGNAGETGFQPIIIDITESAVRNIGCSMDDDIDTAKSFDRSINKCSAILMICNIGRKTFGISTGRDNFRFHFFAIRYSSRAEHDIGTRSGKSHTDGAAHSATATGHYDCLVAEIFHYKPSLSNRD